MKYQYCKNDGTKMNRLYFNKVKFIEKKKQGTVVMLDYFWCQKCEEIFKIDFRIEDIIPSEIKIDS